MVVERGQFLVNGIQWTNEKRLWTTKVQCTHTHIHHPHTHKSRDANALRRKDAGGFDDTVEEEGGATETFEKGGPSDRSAQQCVRENAGPVSALPAGPVGGGSRGER